MAVRLALAAALGAALAACAVGNYGTLAANVERRGAAAVLELYSLGLHVRTRDDDRGAHLGYSRRVYTFAADDTLRPGWYFLHVPLPAQDAVAQDLLTLGVELSTVAPVAGLSLGYSRSQLHARVPVDGSLYIGYAGPEMRVNRVHVCQEDRPCATPSPPR